MGWRVVPHKPGQAWPQDHGLRINASKIISGMEDEAVSSACLLASDDRASMSDDAQDVG